MLYTRLTDAELKEALRLAEAATPGPWTVDYSHGTCGVYGIAEVTTSEEDDANIPFIESSRTLVPRLVKELLKAREEIEDLKIDLKYADMGDDL